MLEELDYDYRVHGDRQREADQSIAVKFYYHPVQDDEASERENRPIYVDHVFVEKRVRGDRNNVVNRPARPEDKKMYRDAYANFLAGEETANVGTPLSEWPLITKSMVEELKHFSFITIEQLAAASDGVCSKFAGLQTYKQKAILWLEAAKGAPAIESINARLAALENEREVKDRQLAEAIEEIKRLTAQNEVLQKKGK